jgi:hypothetical protein
MFNPRDILREAKAEIEGISPDSVTFSNYRTKKYKKEEKNKKIVDKKEDSPIIGNSEGLILTNACPEFISYADIGKKRKIRKKDNLEQWGAFDFFRYAQKKYIDKYGKGWDLNIGGGSLAINKVRDKLSDLFGFCCNLIMRDYIDFFFDNYIDSMIRNQGAFYFSQMSKDKIICEFNDGYDFANRFEKYISQEKTDKDNILKKEEIRESYQLGDTTLVSNYGIVIAMNWLLNNKKIKPDDAVRSIIKAIRELQERGLLNIVKKSTEAYSPYPLGLRFKAPQLVMKRIDPSVEINVDFGEEYNDKYKFLQ